MPVTFGAVGDIISVCLLVKDLAEALDKARGSKAEYQAAIRELSILDCTLLEIDLLTRQHGDGATPELRGLCETAKRAVDRCQDLVNTFLERIRKYQRTFDQSQKLGLLKEASMAVRWRIGEREALEQFRVEIAGTSSSLQMLLVTASVTLLAVNRREMSDKLDEAERRTDQANSVQTTALSCIKDRIEDANRSIEAGNSVLGKVSDALRLDWLRQLGSELKCLLRGAMAVNVATYRAVIHLQASLPSRLERGLIEEPVILEDPIGRVAPVHLQFVTSWDAFNAVLELRFQNVQGYKKMKQREYALQDGGTGKEVEHSRAWQSALLPGQRIEMSFIFHRDESAPGNNNCATCPGCQTPSENSSDADIRCTKCLMWFRRITVVQDDEPLLQASLPKDWQPKPGFFPDSGSSNNTSRKRKLLTDIEDEDEPRDFRRVRVVSTHKRTKRFDSGVVDKEQVAFMGAPLGDAQTSTFASMQPPSSDVGQIAPPGRQPRLTATLWEDEGSLCFQVEAKNRFVARREDNHMINGTKMLNVAGLARGPRDDILKLEETRHVVKTGPMQLKGVWIPFERALELAIKEGIVDDLYPLFVYDIAALLYHPINQMQARPTSP